MDTESTKIHYIKEYKTAEELVSLMKDRGLSFENETKAVEHIKNIGYYRFSGFVHFFLQNPKTNHQFYPEYTFENILTIYRFDKKTKNTSYQRDRKD